MFLMYLDDSGTPGNTNQKFFVLAGFSIFERQTHWLESQLNPIAARFNPHHPELVELHGSPMRSGRDGWDKHPPADRVQAVTDALHLLTNPHMRPKVFAAVIEKSLVPVADIIPTAFEAIATRFDDYLKSCYDNSNGKNPQRGIVIFDKATFEQSVQSLTRVFKHHGHTSGKLRNFAEVPLFLDSRASRLIQMADLIAYWIYRRYEADDDRGFKILQPCIHRYGGVSHGLFEMITPETQQRLQNIGAQQYPFPPPTP